jgi:hypothetical protein
MAGAGAVALLLVAISLSSEQQGYYFTFDSLLNLKIIFELGLSYVIMQCASHEMGRLRWTADRIIVGDPTARNRLRDLYRLALKWYMATAILLCAILVPLGYVFFETSTRGSGSVDWVGPWILLVCSTGLSLLLSPFWAIVEGCGLVASVARVRLTEAVFNSCLLWLLLLLRAGLWSIAFATCAGVLTQIFWLGIRYRGCFVDLTQSRSSPPSLDWRKEIWPFQWRIALSWFSGYCIFTIFNPLVFRILGPVPAGRIGMTFAVAQGIVTLSIVVVKTKAPIFGMLLAKRDFATLDSLFFHSLKRSMAVVALMASAFFLTVVALNVSGSHYAVRFLDSLQIAIVMCATLANCATQSVAVYLRANKEEPLLIPSVLSALVSLPLNYVLISRFGTLGGCAGFFFVSFFLNGIWSLSLFLKKRIGLMKSVPVAA